MNRFRVIMFDTLGDRVLGKYEGLDEAKCSAKNLNQSRPHLTFYVQALSDGYLIAKYGYRPLENKDFKNDLVYS